MDDRQLQEIQLDQKALTYIAERLQHGKTLAQLVLRALDLQCGSVRTFLPYNCDRRGINNFDEGGKLAELPESEWRRSADALFIPTANANPALVRVLRGFLLHSSERLCIFEDALARPEDPALKRKNSRIVTFQDEVYYVLTFGDADDASIDGCVREATSVVPMLGVMTSVSSASDVLPVGSDRLSASTLSTLAIRTEGIVIGAYDGESYLIWTASHVRK